MATNHSGEELHQMTFHNLKDDICLESAEQMYRLQKHDAALGFSSGYEYPKDPHTESTSEDCRACHFYLSTFLKQTMRRVRWKPEQLYYFCTGCKKVKQLPPKGTLSTDLAICKDCKTTVIDSFT